jgi:hypothetical protein
VAAVAARGYTAYSNMLPVATMHKNHSVVIIASYYYYWCNVVDAITRSTDR